VTKKLYVGNLPYNAGEPELRALFEQVGEIADATVITDRETGRSKGFGFVEMVTEEGAQEAIRRFNGFQMNNRPLTVNEARPREERSGGGGYGGGGGGRRGGNGGGGGYGGGGGGYGGGGDRDRRGGGDRY
jgi:RNA recognition motif-containing protein